MISDGDGSLGNILLNVLYNARLTVFLPWRHTEFQTSPISKPFLLVFSMPFSYLQMVPRMHDLAGI